MGLQAGWATTRNPKRNEIINQKFSRRQGRATQGRGRAVFHLQGAGALCMVRAHCPPSARQLCIFFTPLNRCFSSLRLSCYSIQAQHHHNTLALLHLIICTQATQNTSNDTKHLATNDQFKSKWHISSGYKIHYHTPKLKLMLVPKHANTTTTKLDECN